jgi:hypothetical protein
MRRSALYAVTAAVVLLLAVWLYVQGKQESERKLQALQRQLEEANRSAQEADERLLELPRTRPPGNATGGAPSDGPTDFPVRNPEPPAPIKEFLRKEPRR